MLQKARELSLECVERKRDNGLRWDIQGPDHTEPFKKVSLYSKNTSNYKESCKLESLEIRCSCVMNISFPIYSFSM